MLTGFVRFQTLIEKLVSTGRSPPVASVMADKKKIEENKQLSWKGVRPLNSLAPAAVITVLTMLASCLQKRPEMVRTLK